MASLARPAPCADCGTELAPALLSCPTCHRLVHAEELRRLAAEAEGAQRAGDLTPALASWRHALDLLPSGSRQHETVTARIAELSRQMDAAGAAPAPRPSWVKRAGPLGVLLLVAWKLKAVLVFVLTKAKLLLTGLTKAGTLLSMFLSLGVYWAAWGWKFAAGLIASMYVHEMGHVAALQRYGIKATAPMFIPGFGAIVRLKQYPASPREDARVGLAGPLWGLGAALAFYLAFLVSRAPILAAIAVWAARLNLFNLVPLWQLDGSRGLRALSRPQRWLVVLAVAAALAVTAEGLLWLVLIVAVLRALGSDAAREADWPAFAEFVALIVVLSALGAVHVPVPVME